VPTWHDYLVLALEQPNEPDIEFLPQDNDERKVFDAYLAEGWEVSEGMWDIINDSVDRNTVDAQVIAEANGEIAYGVDREKIVAVLDRRNSRHPFSSTPVRRSLQMRSTNRKRSPSSFHFQAVHSDFGPGLVGGEDRNSQLYRKSHARPVAQAAAVGFCGLDQQRGGKCCVAIMVVDLKTQIPDDLIDHRQS
jgi:hypothetical protein